MATLDPGIVPERKLEPRLWREATTVYMTSGHGGCGPYGLVLAAARRGFPMEDMEKELHSLGMPLHMGSITDTEMETRVVAFRWC